MMADQFWPLAASLAVFCWLFILAYGRPTAVVALAIGLFAGESIFGSAPGIDVAGIVVYGRDAVFLAMATAGVIRLATVEARRRMSSLGGWVWWSLLLLASVSLLRGVQLYGADLAGNDFRPAFYLVAGIVGIVAHPNGSSFLRDIVDVWIGAALLLVALGLLRVVGVTIGMPIDEQPFLDGRPIYAWSTVFIAQAALMSLFAAALDSRWRAVPGLPYLLMIGVLLFRHRTVWAALAVSLIAMWTFLRPEKAVIHSQANRRWAGLLVSALLLVSIVLAGKGGSLERDLTIATATATSEGSTFLWRVEGWKALLEDQGANPRDLLFGIPYGAGYHREVFNTEVEYSPHSWYVQTVSRVGVTGCGFMLLALLRLFRRGRATGLFPRTLGSLLILSTVVYGIAYYPPEIDGILLGLVVLSAGHRSTQDAEEEEPGSISATTLRPSSGTVAVSR